MTFKLLPDGWTAAGGNLKTIGNTGHRLFPNDRENLHRSTIVLVVGVRDRVRRELPRGVEVESRDESELVDHLRIRKCNLSWNVAASTSEANKTKRCVLSRCDISRLVPYHHKPPIFASRPPRTMPAYRSKMCCAYLNDDPPQMMTPTKRLRAPRPKEILTGEEKDEAKIKRATNKALKRPTRLLGSYFTRPTERGSQFWPP
ncbi:hypothetical protein R3P38DRAFT_3451732 [Favolaschia claudopus]|uniref:Uncharacterized protein n=1 Tax=Favolaschia claudopus TaxID=2862362 RepID=A0AAV9ZKZ3_9AGAR